MEDKKGKIFLHIVLITGVIFTLIPFIWMFLTSVKTLGESIQVPPVIFPSEFKWSNYKDVMATMPFMKFYYNTIIYTVIRTIGQIIFCSMAAYAFA
ncbi:MAG: carbohydrate ABC transporter permease, partial [Cetobacterium sp.]